MKICRFNDNRLGEVVGDRVYDVTAFAAASTPAGDPLIDALPALLAADLASRRGGPVHELAEVVLHAPVRAPGKIVAAPVNYKAHIAEASADPGVVYGHTLTDIGEAGLFLKANSSLAGPSDPLTLRFPGRRTDYEVELVAVIGKTGSDIPEAEALDHVAGYTVGLDITLRGPEDRSFRKSIDGYSIIGPWLTTADEVADPNQLDLTLHLNGALRQSANTRQMVYGVARLIAFASTFYTLHPGDILFTGTPEGVGPIVAGDEMRAAVQGLGEMRIAVLRPSVIGVQTIDD